MDANSWKAWKKLRAFRRFIDFKCVLSGHEKMTTNPMSFDVSFLCEDKMMAIILDCLESLCVVQQERFRNKEQLSIQIAKNKLFKLTMSRIGLGLVDNEDTKVLETNVNVERLKSAFPDVLKGKDSRTWLPLHWGVVLLDTPESVAMKFTPTDLVPLPFSFYPTTAHPSSYPFSNRYIPYPKPPTLILRNSSTVRIHWH